MHAPLQIAQRVEKTMYFPKKKLSQGAVIPLTIIGQGSPYNMHIYTMWSFFVHVPSFTKIPQRDLTKIYPEFSISKKFDYLDCQKYLQCQDFFNIYESLLSVNILSSRCKHPVSRMTCIMACFWFFKD
jgi:hypothetical protein